MKWRIKFSVLNSMTKYWNTSLVFLKIKGFGFPQGQGGGGGNAISYEGVTVGVTYIHENEALINFIFFVSVNVNPRWKGQGVEV